MPELTISLLGAFAVAADGASATHFRSDKALALAAYLAVEADQPHSRQSLTALLWPDKRGDQARNNLRVTLYRLRRGLDALAPGVSDRLLAIDRQTVQLDSGAAEIDLRRFQSLLADVRGHDHQSLGACPACMAALTTAVDLYRSELLSGFGLADAPAFEEWLLVRRESMHVQATHALHDLAHALEHQGQAADALRHGYRLVDLDPYREASQALLMRLLARCGETDQALAHYGRWVQMLRAEFDEEPSAQTQALVEQIRRGLFHPPSWTAGAVADGDSVAADRAPARRRPDIPEIGAFFGRRQELAQLEQWARAEDCRVVALLGLGGQGKTTLAAWAAHTLADHFDVVVWRSLLNAPRLDELLSGVLAELGERPQAHPPRSLQAQLHALLQLLRDRRALLIFDNMESVLQEESHGRYRQGYEAYGRLIADVASHVHQGCLWLTSREAPADFLRLQRNDVTVRSMILSGLDVEAGSDLLKLYGLGADRETAADLAARYSGNPLALHLVAETIGEFYFNDVQAFLGAETPIFADIRDVLNEQFARLTPLERDVLYCLAIARAPVTPPDISAHLGASVQRHELLDALRSLQRRSLLQRSDSGFTLQNVLMEYLTERLVSRSLQEILAGDIHLLQRHALLHIHALGSVRQSQRRLLLQPLADRLIGAVGPDAVEELLHRRIHPCRAPSRRPAYAAGNLINLLIVLECDLTGCDFSLLNIRQVDFSHTTLQAVNLTGAHLTDALFADSFGRILAVAAAPVGDIFAIAGDQGEIRLLHLSTRAQIDVLSGHHNSVTALAFRPDGTQLASASLDGTVVLWDRQNGTTVRLNPPEESAFHSVAYHPRGTMIAAGGQDAAVHVWDTRDGSLLTKLTVSSGIVHAVAFSPDGRLLAAGDSERSLALWDLSSGQQADPASTKGSRWTRHLLQPVCDHRVLALLFTGDGSRLIVGSSDTTIRMVDTRTRQVIRTLAQHTHWVRALALNRAGTVLYSAGGDRTIVAWDCRTGEAQAVLYGHEHVIRSLALTPDEQTLISGGLDDSVRLWAINPSQPPSAVWTIQGYSLNVCSAAVSPDGRICVIGDSKGHVRHWQIEDAAPVPESHRVLPGTGLQVNMVTFSADGRYLASADDDTEIRVWDFAEGRLIDTLTAHSAAVHSLAFTPDGRKLVSGAYDGDIILWEMNPVGHGIDARILCRQGPDVKALCLLADGVHLFSLTTDDSVRLWDLCAGTCLRVFPNAYHRPVAMALSPRDDFLAVTGDSGAVKLFRIDEQLVLHPDRTLVGHMQTARKLVFSPDGGCLASSGDGGSIRLWSLQDGAEGRGSVVLDAHTQAVPALAFSPDGRYLVSGSRDQTLRIWDAAGGEIKTVFEVPGPYAGMKITGVRGISPLQRAVLRSLGAVDGAAGGTQRRR